MAMYIVRNSSLKTKGNFLHSYFVTYNVDKILNWDEPVFTCICHTSLKRKNSALCAMHWFFHVNLHVINNSICRRGVLGGTQERERLGSRVEVLYTSWWWTLLESNIKLFVGVFFIYGIYISYGIVYLSWSKHTIDRYFNYGVFP